jgi:hypothetical protein
MAIVLDGTNGVTTNSGTLISATTIGVGGATPSTSGAGITFPATQSASTDANTLDDYEEGTWTPVIQGTTTNGTATYTSNAGRYVKIGRLVFIETYVGYNSGNGTGSLRLGGLPFTAANVALFPGMVISYFDNITMSANNFPLAYVNQNTTDVLFYQCPTGGGANGPIAYDGAGNIQISGCYTV